MRLHPLPVPLAALLLLAGCANDAAGDATAAKDRAWNGDRAMSNAANPYCHIADRAIRRFRPGDSLPFRMTVVNGGSWCFGGVNFQDASAGGGGVDDQPSHGQVRLLPQQGGVVYGYRPNPGYVGGDGFSVLVQTGYLGIESHVTVSVDVKAP